METLSESVVAKLIRLQKVKREEETGLVLKGRSRVYEKLIKAGLVYRKPNGLGKKGQGQTYFISCYGETQLNFQMRFFNPHHTCGGEDFRLKIAG